MILDSNQASASGARSQMVSHITGEVLSVCQDSMGIDAGDVQEVAMAIECFLEEQPHASCVESDSLVMLASRALSSLGEDKAARKLLLFGTGMIKPSEWEVRRGGETWILDLKQLTVRNDAPLEMVLFAGLNAILESIADVWDASSGEGTLGLRHVCSVATELLGSGARGQEAMVAELMNTCRAKFNQLKVERNWNAVPDVMNLDV